MHYYNGKFYTGRNENIKELKILRFDSLFTYFDNNSKYLTVKVNNKVKNHDASKAIQIKTKIYLGLAA